MEFSEKQLYSIRNSDKVINIWHGSVRSGKTYASLWRFFDLLRNGPPGTAMIVGRTMTSLRRNILDPMVELLGSGVRFTLGANARMHFYGRIVELVSCNDARAEGRIQGCTLMGAYVDEGSLYPESFFDMLRSRLSVAGAKMMLTTNPDSPHHWLKKKWIDLDENAPLSCTSFHFELKDNPALPKEYVEQLKASHKGLWYKRFVLGQWVKAEGAVYDFFSQERHCIDFPPTTDASYILGIDYGTFNPFACVLIGQNKSSFPRLWVEAEYYYDSVKEQRQKTDAEYAYDVVKFITGKRIEAIYVDPSAASFKLELIRSGVENVFDAKNEVLDGIRIVSEFLHQGTLKICNNCTNIIEEIEGYVWDPKAQLKGEDKPLKEKDHTCFPENTIISPQLKIQNIKVGDFVLTSKGLKKVSHTIEHLGLVYEYFLPYGSIKTTPNHPFYTLNGWKKVDDLIPSDILFIIKEWENTENQKQWFGKEKNIEDIQNHLLLAINGISKNKANFYIEKYGNHIMEKFQKDFIYITSTKTPLIMILPIWSVLAQKSTQPFIHKIIRLFQKMHEKQLLNGINLKKAENGIKNTRNDLNLEDLIQNNTNANNVKISTIVPKDPESDFVQINVKLSGEETLELITSRNIVSIVTNNLKLTNTQKQLVVPKVVEKKFLGIKKVYNIKVEEESEYFADGYLVHNCDSLRYAIFSHFFDGGNGLVPGSRDPLSPQDLDRMYNETKGIISNLPRPFQDPNKMY